MTPSPFGTFPALALPLLMSHAGVGSEAIAMRNEISRISQKQSELGSRQFSTIQNSDPYDYVSPRLVPQRIIRLKILRGPRIQPKPYEFEGEE